MSKLKTCFPASFCSYNFLAWLPSKCLKTMLWVKFCMTFPSNECVSRSDGVLWFTGLGDVWDLNLSRNVCSAWDKCFSPNITLHKGWAAELHWIPSLFPFSFWGVGNKHGVWKLCLFFSTTARFGFRFHNLIHNCKQWLIRQLLRLLLWSALVHFALLFRTTPYVWVPTIFLVLSVQKELV